LLGRGIKEVPSIAVSAAQKYGKAHEKENILVTKYKIYIILSFFIVRKMKTFFFAAFPLSPILADQVPCGRLVFPLFFPYVVRRGSGVLIAS
jgi:hypothetical protein